MRRAKTAERSDYELSEGVHQTKECHRVPILLRAGFNVCLGESLGESASTFDYQVNGCLGHRQLFRNLAEALPGSVQL